MTTLFLPSFYSPPEYLFWPNLLPETVVGPRRVGAPSACLDLIFLLILVALRLLWRGIMREIIAHEGAIKAIEDLTRRLNCLSIRAQQSDGCGDRTSQADYLGKQLELTEAGA